MVWIALVTVIVMLFAAVLVLRLNDLLAATAAASGVSPARPPRKAARPATTGTSRRGTTCRPAPLGSS